jgi:hypothetical protein
MTLLILAYLAGILTILSPCILPVLRASRRYYDLGTWLPNGNSNDHWDRNVIADATREGDQKRIDLGRAIPVAWIYLDAWASADGTVHYRPDVYGLDGAADGHQTRR